MFTPFASVRADAASMQINNDPGVANYIETGDSNLVRGMPTVGVEYRYPFINVQSWGTQTIEPIAQVIVRPNETQIGRWPNEDAQSLVFDDSNLFRINKFSGWDRVEGGGRANYGVQYTAQFNQGGFVNVLFGQSYNLFGQNSFALGGTTNTGLDSGLDTTQSDYVARVSYQPNSTYMFTSRFRFDNDTFEVKRTELEGRANFDRWSGALLYGDYAAQPELGFLDRRQGILGTGQVKLDANWVLAGLGALRPQCREIRSNPRWSGLCRRLPHLGPELHYQLHLQRKRAGQPHGHAATEPAHAGRHVGWPAGRSAGVKLRYSRAGARELETSAMLNVSDKAVSWLAGAMIAIVLACPAAGARLSSLPMAPRSPNLTFSSA